MNGNNIINLVNSISTNYSLTQEQTSELVRKYQQDTRNIDMIKIAEGCGYETAIKITNKGELKNVLSSAKKSDKLTFIEVLSDMGSRDDLGRPTTTANENKENFMKYLKGKN